MMANCSIKEERAGVDSKDYSRETPNDQLQIVYQNVVDPKKSQEVTVLWCNCNIPYHQWCHSMSSESYHYIKDHWSEWWSGVETIVEAWSRSLMVSLSSLMTAL